MRNPFRYFNSSPEVIRLTVMMYIRYPLSLRQVEDLLFERGIDVCHETVRFWWNRFGPIFAAEIRKRRVHHRSYSQWRWHLDEVFVRIAETLRETFGGSGMSVKTVMTYTGAGEHTVKNWFEGKNGPNCENLVKLVRHSDEVLEALLLMAGREDILAGKLLVDARDKLVEMLEIIDQLQADDSVADPPND